MIPRAYLISMLVVALASLVAGAIAYPHMPEQVPTHFDLSGNADAWGPRWVVAYLFPGLDFVIIGLLAVLPLIGPFRKNFDRFRVTYAKIGLMVVLLFAAINGMMIMAALGSNVPVGNAMSVLIGAFMVPMGNWLGKVQRNFYLGIRTPWTLANETVWYRTHRVGGRLLMLAGLIGVVGGLTLPSNMCFWVFIGSVGAVAAWSIVYSYVIYKRLGSVDDLSRPSATQA